MERTPEDGRRPAPGDPPTSSTPPRRERPPTPEGSLRLNTTPQRPSFAEVARSPARPTTPSRPASSPGRGMVSLRIGGNTPRLCLSAADTTPARRSPPAEEKKKRPSMEAVVSLRRAESQGAIPRRLGPIREEIAEETREERREDDTPTERREPSVEVPANESLEAEESRRAQRELETYVANSPVVTAAAPTPSNRVAGEQSDGPPKKKRKKSKKKKPNPRRQLTVDDYVSTLPSDTESDDREPGPPSRTGFFGGVFGGVAEIDWSDWSPTRREDGDGTPEPDRDERAEEAGRSEREGREREQEEEQQQRQARNDEQRRIAERAAAAAEERQRRREDDERRLQEEQRARDEAASAPVEPEPMEMEPPAPAATPQDDASREEAIASRNARRNAARAARRRHARRMQREEPENRLPARDSPVSAARTAEEGRGDRERRDARELPENRSAERTGSRSSSHRTLPVKERGAWFGGLRPIPTNPTIDPAPYTCFNCWQPGHGVAHCTKGITRDFCGNCGRHGVQVDSCPRCAEALRVHQRRGGGYAPIETASGVSLVEESWDEAHDQPREEPEPQVHRRQDEREALERRRVEERERRYTGSRHEREERAEPEPADHRRSDEREVLVRRRREERERRAFERRQREEREEQDAQHRRQREQRESERQRQLQLEEEARNRRHQEARGTPTPSQQEERDVLLEILRGLEGVSPETREAVLRRVYGEERRERQE